MSLWFERALFVVGPQNSGKSTQLRSMFFDQRLGSHGKLPSIARGYRLREVYHLSNERRLLVRLSSPHESGETPKEFMNKIKRKTVFGRWCFAGAFQPNAYRVMPDVVASVSRFKARFEPERIRVVFLYPNRNGATLDSFLPGRDLSQELLQIPNVEVACIDARERDRNGLFLADFFDFI